ncbi:MAG TPA: hypothetical protein VG713_08630 [Pirellulales bacterium]|nr:hypothetical protein [Pirellulales bacterium]
MMWIPRSWGEIVGNGRTVQGLKNLLRTMKFDGMRGPNTFVKGQSRTGKTSQVKLFAQCLLCEQLDPNTLDPCNGTCSFCRRPQNLELLRAGDGISGLYSFSSGFTYQYTKLDCPSLTDSLLTQRLAEIHECRGGHVVHLEEAHRLAARSLFERLLIPLEERGVMWIATSIRTTGLDRAFLNRFPVKLTTSKPSISELARWLAARCSEQQITVDDPETLRSLAQLADCNPGRALNLLTEIQLMNRGNLTADFMGDR